MNSEHSHTIVDQLAGMWPRRIIVWECHPFNDHVVKARFMSRPKCQDKSTEISSTALYQKLKRNGGGDHGEKLRGLTLSSDPLFESLEAMEKDRNKVGSSCSFY